ncbi:hypothetical protein GQ55_9G207500 [Panicum hallii var. hallii]|uniref:BED-type domain-containing protein n=1 Tax=Panicum hallii var. hallii TaxID=1504633 RepID=A0A2T7C5F1_9POAL|nr:hypothetical protein GQ55_9G207500 [Panicum hallii var. hallii]
MEPSRDEAEAASNNEVEVVMDMEEYTINDDLMACGLPGDNDGHMVASTEALFGSSIAPINVDFDATASDGDGGGVGASAMPTGTLTPTAFTGNTGRLKRVMSVAWNDFDKVLETLPNGKQVRVAAKCRHCSRVLSGHSSASTGHLLRAPESLCG